LRSASAIAKNNEKSSTTVPEPAEGLSKAKLLTVHILKALRQRYCSTLPSTQHHS
jgi:hypothetical protein